jgi:hypothetical protein
MNQKTGLELEKIISGGQTGADMGGLIAAKRLRLKTGGCAPSGYKTERGVNKLLKDFYKLNDYGVSYAKRTSLNILDSHGTVIFADDLESPGTKLTINYCKKFNKPYIINPSERELYEWTYGKK